MRKFFINCCIFIFIFGMINVVWISLFIYSNQLTSENFPSPELTNSYSFNSKLHFLKNKKSKNIAIGSSMTLNNLASEVLINKIRTNDFLNYSSWGLSIVDMFKILKISNKIHKVKRLFMASNLVDFIEDPKIFDAIEIENYLKNDFDVFYYLKHLNFKYYFTNWKYTKYVRSGSNFQESLVYDKYGGVLLSENKFIYSKERWNSPFIYPMKSELNYQYLDSIAHFCKSYGIDLMVVQSPTRKSLLTNMTEVKILRNHISKMENILVKQNHYFIDGNRLALPDDCYVDGTHLNSKGAIIFTNFIFDLYNQHKLLKI